MTYAIKTITQMCLSIFVFYDYNRNKGNVLEAFLYDPICLVTFKYFLTIKFCLKKKLYSTNILEVSDNSL